MFRSYITHRLYLPLYDAIHASREIMLAVVLPRQDVRWMTVDKPEWRTRGIDVAHSYVIARDI